jgi:cell wall-associated NlpC family hydrolase
MKLFLFFSILLFYPTVLFCQVYAEKDIEICKEIFKLSKSTNLDAKPIGDVIVRIGESFMGTDYKAYTLETGGVEKLVVDLKGFDCTTFVESVLAFARLIKKDSASFENYLNELTYIRYRDGIINSYTSRLHYFSDWIFDNIKKNVIQDITKNLGGVAVKFQVNFMSSHPSQYKHLKRNPSFISVIQTQEDSINTRTYFYIPKDRMKAVEGKLRDGDLIAFTTSVQGLDIGHVGIVLKGKDGGIHLLHAPQSNTKVQISKDTLSDYILNLSKDTGIIVLRVLEP